MYQRESRDSLKESFKFSSASAIDHLGQQIRNKYFNNAFMNMNKGTDKLLKGNRNHEIT